MTDIEKAIEYIKINYEKLSRGIDYSSGKDHTAITLFDKQAELVIQALQEKAEREKGCEYCNSALAPIYQISTNENPTFKTYEPIFCPNCGRKLGVRI